MHGNNNILLLKIGKLTILKNYLKNASNLGSKIFITHHLKV